MRNLPDNIRPINGLTNLRRLHHESQGLTAEEQTALDAYLLGTLCQVTPHEVFAEALDTALCCVADLAAARASKESQQ